MSEAKAAPGRRAASDAAKLSPTARAILAAYREAGLVEPPSPQRLAHRLGAKRQIVEGLVEHLRAAGHLVSLGGFIVSREAVEAARAKLLADGRESLDIRELKELFGLTRKLLLPLLEHLDRAGVTIREPGRRRVRRG